MIDETRTFKLFGYISSELKPRSRKKIIRICNQCGREDIMGFGDYNRGNKNLCRFCSRKNKLKLPKPKFVSESNRFIPGTGIDRILTIKKFGYDPVELKSKSCRNVVTICQKCGKIRNNLFYNYRDLCRSCAGKTENITLTCQQCDKEFEVNLSGKNRKFCSRECMAKSMTITCKGEGNSQYGICGKDSPRWKGGLSYGEYCEKFNENCRESNRNKYNNKCFICGKSEEENLDKNGKHRKLSVHHIDMNKNQGCDDNEWALVPVCMGCHTKLHTKLWEVRIKYLIGD